MKRWIRLLLGGLGGLVIVVGGTYAWALVSLDTSTVARALVWLQSDVGDIDRFPARTIAASPSPFTLGLGPTSGALSEAKVDGKPLDVFLEETGTTAFLVVHGDSLVYERYFGDGGRETLRTSFSSAKSFVSTLIGIAVEDGSIGSIDDPITDYLPELLEADRRFGDITIRHLLNMSSGIRYVEEGLPWSDDAVTYYAPDLRAAALSVSIEGPPGATFVYNNYNLLLEGLILERATGMPVAKYMESRLWQPLGAGKDASWSLDSEWSGFEKMESGINARPIDFALLGIAFRDRGRIGGRQVIPEHWVREVTRGVGESDVGDPYRYHWWLDSEHRAFAAIGRYGQFISVHPSEDVVIVRMGSHSGGVVWKDVLAALALAAAS